MTRRSIVLKLVLAMLAASPAAYGGATDGSTAPARLACELESFPELPDVRLTSAAKEAAPAPHCKVAGVIGTETNFELLLPDDWNGKFVMGGGGGFVGSVRNTALMFGALQAGYATVGTDTGHQGHPLDASWAYNNLERLVSFGHQAVHRTAVTAKPLTRRYYQDDIARSYFTGCSRGGGQALMEAQRYPEDFDGIVAGAPAYNWTPGLAALASQINQAMYPDPEKLEEAVIGPAEQELIESSYLEACDAQDGLPDRILSDPSRCQFDVATLLCQDDASDGCLSEQQLAAVKVVYGGPRDSQGHPMFYGFSFGGETAIGGWSRWLTGGLKHLSSLDEFQGGVDAGDFEAPVAPSAFYGFGNGIMRYFVYNDPDWTYENYDFDALERDSARVADTLNATNPDLSAFRERGGKLIIYSGWSDAAVPAAGVIGYYEEVLAHDETAAADVRLFMMPGVEHCFGGPGPSWVNFLTEIDNWVETGEAPDQVTAAWLNKQLEPDGTRPVCAYPSFLKYNGTGDSRDAASFRCVDDD